ncbi:MAG: hypothetical protein M1834_005893 [Cirrosporium novae-zelandiae]|nr:MAG: hypothetical protein M1834_005893 [Cirrosporium novae-zelandiae]
MSPLPKKAQAVTVSLKDLQNGTVPFSTLEEAFGPSSLGILVVRSLPSSFPSLRSRVLSSASYLAHLPQSKLDALTRPDAKYLVGWSHGVETLRPGVVDILKGSYYINCAFHTDPTLQCAPPPFVEYTTPNIWPPLRDFQTATTELCNLMISTAALVARACDQYATQKIPSYTPKNLLENVVRTSTTTKARLLHYFPPAHVKSNSPTPAQTSIQKSQDGWCATHVDHGCLTALTSAMLIDESTTLIPALEPNQPLTPLPELNTNPSPNAGLYIRSRSGSITKIDIPKDCLAFQTGEALESMTKGRFKAVPHFVRGADGEEGEGIARNTLVVFTQPNLEVEVEEGGVSFGEFARRIVDRNTAGRGVGV